MSGLRRTSAAVGTLLAVTLLIVWICRSASPVPGVGDRSRTSQMELQQHDSAQRPRRQRPSMLAMMADGADRARRSSLSVAELRTAAEAGDARAQGDLGARLADCVGREHAHYIELAEANHLRELERLSAEQGMPRTHEELDALRSAHEFEMGRLAECSRLGAHEVSRYHEWLERGARAGDIDAKVGYARLALLEFTKMRPYDLTNPHDTLHANLPEVIRRRNLARTWADDAVRAGNFEILLLLSAQYGGMNRLHDLYPRDSMRWAIYRHTADLALAWMSPWDSGGLENRWHTGPERNDALTDAQWQEAERQARELYLRWYGEAPDG